MIRRSSCFILVIATTFSITALSGCDESLLSDAKEFNDIVVVSAQSIKKTYSGANDYARQCYITEIRFNPHQNIQHVDSKGKAMPLLYKYDPSDIRARELAIQGLLEYSGALAAIAGSDAPEQAAKLASQLATRLGNTADTLSKMNAESKGKDNKNDFRFASYSQPISNLASLAAKTWLKKVQKDSLKKCIEEGYDDVELAFDSLEKDLTDLNHDCYELGAKMAMLEEESYFNNKYGYSKDKPAANTPEFVEFSKIVADKDRLALLNEIRDLGKGLADIMASSPKPILDSLRESHKRLAKHLSSDFVAKKEAEAKLASEQNQNGNEVKQSVAQKPAVQQKVADKKGFIPSFGSYDAEGDTDIKQVAKGNLSGIYDAYKRVKVSLDNK